MQTLLLVNSSDLDNPQSQGIKTILKDYSP
jgi:hypothetical protein